MTTPRSVPLSPPGSLRVALVGLGSNRGDSVALLERAVARLRAHPALALVARSPLYLTQPCGPVHRQPWFLNAVVALETPLGPQALLRLLHRVERAFGRNRAREIRWGPRSLDLDLLFHGARVVRLAGLTLPHPRLHARRFVLQPLADLAPDWVHPGCGKTVDTLLREVDDKGQLIRWPDGRRLTRVNRLDACLADRTASCDPEAVRWWASPSFATLSNQPPWTGRLDPAGWLGTGTD